MKKDHTTGAIQRARACLPLLCLCRSFCICERCLDSNPESCRSKQERYQLSHPSPHSAATNCCVVLILILPCVRLPWLRCWCSGSPVENPPPCSSSASTRSPSTPLSTPTSVLSPFSGKYPREVYNYGQSCLNVPLGVCQLMEVKGLCCGMPVDHCLRLHYILLLIARLLKASLSQIKYKYGLFSEGFYSL